MKFTDYFSPEKGIVKEKFNTIPYMDVWISSIVEGYIYENVSSTDTGIREEYTERYRKIEGEYKSWYSNGQLYAQCYYKEGKIEGEYIWWHENGQIEIQCYFKEGKEEGEYKKWYSTGQLKIQCYFKEGKKEGEFKKWNEQGELIVYKIYTDDVVVEDLQRTLLPSAASDFVAMGPSLLVP